MAQIQAGKAVMPRTGTSRPLREAVAQLKVYRLTRLDQLFLIRDEWTSLYNRAISPSPPQRFEFVVATWSHVSDGRHEILAARRGDELVGLWALYTKRKLLRQATNPGFGVGEEYSGPLILSGADEINVAEKLLKEALKKCDTLKMTVSADHPIILAAKPRLRLEFSVRSPIVDVENFQDFNSWLETKSRSFRQGLRYERRRISKLAPKSASWKKRRSWYACRQLTGCFPRSAAGLKGRTERRFG